MLEKLMTKDRWDSLKTYSVVWLTALITFVGWVTGQTLVTFAVLAVEAGLLLALCEDLTHVLSPAWFFLYARAPGVALSGEWLWLLALIPIVLGIVIHIIRFRPKFFRKEVFGKGFALSFIFAGVTFALGGVGMEGRSPANIGIIVALGLGLPLAYLFLSACINRKAGEPLLNYMAMLIYTLAFLLVLQGIVYFARLGSLEAVKQAINDKAMHLGWGVANMVAPTVGMAIPVALVYSLRKSKWAWVHLLIALFMYAWVFVCTCRGAIIIEGIGLVVMMIYVLVKTPNRLQTWLTVGISLAIVAVLCGVFHKQLGKLFERIIELGFSDNGRFNLYKVGINRFKMRPAFGVGIDYDLGGFPKWAANKTTPYYFHSTPVQILANLGIVGFIAHVFVYFWRYRTFFVGRRNLMALALFAGLLMYDAYGWIDRTYFLISGAILMNIMTLVGEKNVSYSEVKPLTMKLAEYIYIEIKDRPREPADLPSEE